METPESNLVAVAYEKYTRALAELKAIRAAWMAKEASIALVSFEKYTKALKAYSETSTGFDNMCGSYVFDSAAQRDEWLANQTDMASKACTRKIALKYLTKDKIWGDAKGYLYNPINEEMVAI